MMIWQNPLYQEDLSRILQVSGINQLFGKRFLITGASGMIGTCLVDALMKANDEHHAQMMLYAVGRNQKKAAERLGRFFGHPCFSFIEQDVCQPFPDNLAVDYIIPLASLTHPLAYSQMPVETAFTNIKGAEYALEKAAQCGATVLYPSSVEIYGNARDQAAFREEDTGNLNLSTSRACYPESKRMSEALCQSYHAERNVKVKIVRISRAFGPTMLMSDSKASSQFIKNALNGDDIVLKSEGNQLYSYTYVADVVGAMLFVLLHGKEGEAYNISCEQCNVRLKEFAQYCAQFNGKNVVFQLPDSVEKKGYSIAATAILDNSKIKALGYHFHYSMEAAIEQTLRILK